MSNFKPKFHPNLDILKVIKGITCIHGQLPSDEFDPLASNPNPMPIPAHESLWHYTVEDHLGGIYSAQALLPIPDPSALPGEQPVVWFSRHPDFEPSAWKALKTESGYVDVNHRLMLKYGVIAIRFQVKPETPVFDLKGWRVISRLPRSMIKALIAIAKRRGAMPSRDWFVSPDKIRMSSIDHVEHWSSEGWQAGLPDSLPYAFEDGKLLMKDPEPVAQMA